MKCSVLATTWHLYFSVYGRPDNTKVAHALLQPEHHWHCHWEKSGCGGRLKTPLWAKALGHDGCGCLLHHHQAAPMFTSSDQTLHCSRSCPGHGHQEHQHFPIRGQGHGQGHSRDIRKGGWPGGAGSSQAAQEDTVQNPHLAETQIATIIFLSPESLSWQAGEVRVYLFRS